MEIVYWIVGGLVAAAFLITGVFKLVQTKEQLKAKGMNWTDLYSPRAVKGIGVLELLGAVGLIVPPLTGIAVWLAPAAAVGLAAVMIGAARAHHKLGETIVPNVVLGALALATAPGERHDLPDPNSGKHGAVPRRSESRRTFGGHETNLLRAFDRR